MHGCPADNSPVLQDRPVLDKGLRGFSEDRLRKPAPSSFTYGNASDGGPSVWHASWTTGTRQVRQDHMRSHSGNLSTEAVVLVRKR